MTRFLLCSFALVLLYPAGIDMYLVGLPRIAADLQASEAQLHIAFSVYLAGMATAMLFAGVKKVYYAYSNEDGEPYDLSAARGYVEFAKPEDQRELTLISHHVRDEGEDLYEAWQKAVATTA